ncbi:MAG: ABC-2 family transporter protein [Anaerolineales bacterium]|nr:ABC-2 family transporter protein [Anaerolineales bacterium]
MTGLAGVYRQQMKTSIAAMLQYRAALVIWLISQVLDPVIYLIVWSTVTAASGGEAGGYTRGDFAAYFLVLMLVNNTTYSWIMHEYEYRVREGTLSAALLRPVHPIHADIADNLASKMISTPMMLALAVGLGFVFRPTIHLVPWAVAAFVPAVALAFVLRFLIEWTLALAAFWTTRVSALNQTYFVALLFLSGQVAPLSLFPGFVQAIGLALPFRWMISFPVELLLGNLTPAQTLVGFAAQAGWIGVGLMLVRLAWRAGVRQYSAVGA